VRTRYDHSCGTNGQARAFLDTTPDARDAHERREGDGLGGPATAVGRLAVADASAHEQSVVPGSSAGGVMSIKARS